MNTATNVVAAPVPSGNSATFALTMGSFGTQSNGAANASLDGEMGGYRA